MNRVSIPAPVRLLACATALLLSLPASAAAQAAPGHKASAALFAYDATAPLDIREMHVARIEGVEIRDITYNRATGGRYAAYVVEPGKRIKDALKPGKRAGVLFAHWYESEAPDSNRTQFLHEAVELAQAGVVSVLTETMWSDPKFFGVRTQAVDYENSIGAVKDLRRALDVLLARDDVDRERVAFVGHDFGAMYGALLAGVDKRPTSYVFIAGAKSFSDWYLFQPELEGAARQAFIDRMSVLDPIRFLPDAAPNPVLLQFGDDDFFVPQADGRALVAATGEPKTSHWYPGWHSLTAQARVDRLVWLKKQLGV